MRIYQMLVSGLIFTPVMSFACPDLAGEYLCDSDGGGREKTSISHRKDAGTTVYEIRGGEFRADGEWRPSPFPSETVEYRTVCHNSYLSIELKGPSDDGSKLRGELQLSKQDQKIREFIWIVKTFPNGSEIPMSKEYICDPAIHD